MRLSQDWDGNYLKFIYLFFEDVNVHWSTVQFALFLFKQVKHPEVAQFLGGRLYDCVFKYSEAVS
jgi:hypothetical protein